MSTPPPHPPLPYQRGGVGWDIFVFGTGPSCRLCNLNTLWNILMILGRNVDQAKMTCHIQDWQLWLSYYWSYHPVLFENKIMSALSLQYPLEYFNGTWQKCKSGPEDLSRTRMTTLPFLLLVLSPFVTFDSDNPLISSPLCKSNTLWNIFMILGRNVEQDQEWQHCLYLTFDVISTKDWSWNIFYGHSLPSADSRRAVVSFWRKNVHNTG